MDLSNITETEFDDYIKNRQKKNVLRILSVLTKRRGRTLIKKTRGMDINEVV